MNRVASIFTGFLLAVAFLVGSAHAQAGQKIAANVPFDFTVGSVSLPAGQYEFTRAEDGILVVRGADGHSFYTMANSVQANERAEKSMLKFATVDGRHVLVQVWDERDDVGDELH